MQFEGKTIDQITQLSILDAHNFFEGIALPEAQAKAAERLLYEIRSRLQVLCDVGVEYLTLDRLSNTLSGGESQRITLSTRLGSNLYGAMYVLDEPSIGLHERDTERLIGVVERLRDAGNTIVVVEHDEKMICAADTLVDIGPDAGIHGGEVIYVGSPKTITKETPGYTAGYLSGRLSIPIPTTRRAYKHHITIHNAQKNNLQNLTLDLPLGVLAVVTGISGSGKSTLVRDVLYEDLRLYFDTHEPGSLSGDLKRLKAVEYVDQNMAGRNARSNPATFIGAFDSIRELYSRLPLSRQMGYKPSFFSFNNKNGGRCEECKGEGTIAVEMQFMADLILTCDTCGGKRFKREILEVEYHGQHQRSPYDEHIRSRRFLPTIPQRRVYQSYCLSPQSARRGRPRICANGAELLYAIGGRKPASKARLLPSTTHGRPHTVHLRRTHYRATLSRHFSPTPLPASPYREGAFGTHH